MKSILLTRVCEQLGDCQRSQELLVSFWVAANAVAADIQSPTPSSAASNAVRASGGDMTAPSTRCEFAQLG